MSDYASTGRHRSPGRYSPLSELSVIVSRAGESSVKASAVLAASGGLVAAFALPANAASGSSAPEHKAPRAPASAAPALVAPEAAVPVKAETVGVLGFRAVAKPKPQAVVSRTVVASLSRSAVRAPIVNIPQSSSAIVNIARGLFGIPYVYGGESLSGFDCSGFTQYVYRQAGISIPRTASAQQAAAARVSTPQPGDLVFFGYPAYHVGIYVGNGMMIDAAHSGTVTAVRAIYSGVSGYGRF